MHRGSSVSEVLEKQGLQTIITEKHHTGTTSDKRVTCGYIRVHTATFE